MKRGKVVQRYRHAGGIYLSEIFPQCEMDSRLVAYKSNKNIN